MTHREPGTLPDFQAHAEALRVVVEGQRLTYGHLVNPTFATETAQIDPIPHQRLAVYHHSQPIGQRALLRDLLVLLGATRPDRIDLGKALRRWTDEADGLPISSVAVRLRGGGSDTGAGAA